MIVHVVLSMQINSCISAEISDDIKMNDIGNDWSGNFCEYDIDEQHDGSVCHLS